MTISPALHKFLDLIAFSESTSTSPITKNNGYDVIVTGVNGPAIFEDYAKHPFEDGGTVLVRRGPPPLYSTAAGRYQLLARYWKIYKSQLGLPDYSPASQDAVALEQMKERGAIDLVLAGDIKSAITNCSTIWASFPGNNYGQGGHSMNTLLARYGAAAEGSACTPMESA